MIKNPRISPSRIKYLNQYKEEDKKLFEYEAWMGDFTKQKREKQG